LPAGAKVRTEGETVVLHGSSDPTVVDAWPNVMACGTREELPASSGEMQMDMRSKAWGR
jgi:hypothetical protein